MLVNFVEVVDIGRLIVFSCVVSENMQEYLILHSYRLFNYSQPIGMYVHLVVGGGDITRRINDKI